MKQTTKRKEYLKDYRANNNALLAVCNDFNLILLGEL